MGVHYAKKSLPTTYPKNTNLVLLTEKEYL